MEQYIADRKIMGVTLIEGKTTPAKKELVKVMFEDGTFEIMPKLRLEMISTDEISDATTVQTKVNKHVGSTVFATLHEYGILLGEVDGVLDTCTQLTNSGLHKAQDILFGFAQAKMPLLSINDVLLENNAKENNNGTSAAGGGSDTEDTN